MIILETEKKFEVLQDTKLKKTKIKLGRKK